MSISGPVFLHILKISEQDGKALVMITMRKEENAFWRAWRQWLKPTKVY